MPPIKKPSRDRQKTFLREWRDFRGYTLEQAAEMIGMSRENLGKIEKGRVPYNQDVLELLAEAYNCEVPDLLIRNPIETENLWSIWNNAKQGAKNAIVSFAKTLKSTDESQFELYSTAESSFVRKSSQKEVTLKINTSNGPIEIKVPTRILRNGTKDTVTQAVISMFAAQAAKINPGQDFGLIIYDAAREANRAIEDQEFAEQQEGSSRRIAK